MAIDIGAITATLSMTDDFSAVLAKVQEALAQVGIKTKQTGDDIDASTAKIQASYNRLASSLDPATASAIKYTQAHSTLSAALDKGIISHDTYTSSLEKAGEKFLTAGAGAQSFRDLVAGVTEIAGQAGAATAALGDKIDGLVSNFSGLGAAVAAMGPLVLPIAAIAAALAVVAVGFEAVKTAYSFISDAVSEGMKTQAIIEQLNNTLRNTGSASGLSSADMIKYADSLQWVSGASKDAIIQGEGMLARFTKIGPDAFKPATQLALDYAQATGKDVPEAFKLIGVALEGGQKAFRALVDVGIILDTGQKARLKDMLAMGDVAGYQALMMEALRSKVAGAAAAYEQTLAGSIDRAHKELKATRETIGSEVIPALEDMLRVVTGTAGGWDQLHIKIQSAATSIGEIVRDMVYGVSESIIEWNLDWYQAKASFLSFEEGILSVSEPVSKFMSNVLHIPFVDISDKLNKVRNDIQDTTDDINAQAVSLATLTLQYNDHRKALEGNTTVLPKVKTGLEDLKAAQKSAGEAADGARAAVDKYIVSLMTQDETLQNSIASSGALLAALDKGLPEYEALKQQQITSDAITKAITATNKTYQDQLISLDKTLSGLRDKQAEDKTHKVDYATAIAGVEAQITRLNDAHKAQLALLPTLISGEKALSEAVASGDAIKKANLASEQAIAIARAQLADAESRYTSIAEQVTIAIAAQNKAFSELHVMSGQVYDDRVKELTQQTQYLQGLKDQKLIQDQINAAQDSVSKLRAQISDTNELNEAEREYGTTISGILSKYGLLSSATRELNIETELRNKLQADHIAANSPEARDLENLIRATDNYTTSLKATEAQIAANTQIWKDWAATNAASNTLFVDDLNKMIEGSKVTFQSFVTSLEDIWLKGLEKMIADTLDKNVVQSFTAGLTGVSAPGAGSGGPAAQFAAAVTQFGTYVSALTTGSGLSGLTSGAEGGSAFDTAFRSLSGAGSQLSDSASAGQDMAKFASGAFGANSQYFSDNANEFQLAASALTASAATQTGSSGVSGLGSLVSLFGGYGAVIAAVAVFAFEWIHANQSQFKPTESIGGAPSSTTPTGQSQFTETFFTQRGKDFDDAMNRFLAQIQQSLGGVMTFFPDMGVKIGKGINQFEETMNGHVVQIFSSLQAAWNAAMVDGLKAANWTGLSDVMKDYLNNALAQLHNVTLQGGDTTAVSQQLLAGAQVLNDILNTTAANLAGAGASIATTMKGIVDSASTLRYEVDQMGLSAASMATVGRDINQNEFFSLQQEYNTLIGKKENAAQIKQQEADAFNAEKKYAEAQLLINEAKVLTQINDIKSSGDYLNAMALVTEGKNKLDLEEIVQARILLAALNQSIAGLEQAYKDMLALGVQIANMPDLKPGDIKLPSSGGGSASSSVTTLASAMQTLAQAAEVLTQYGMLPYLSSLLKINDDIDRQEKGLKRNSAAYRDLEQAREDEIKLLQKQTQATTDAIVTPLIQQAHGLSTFAIGLDAIHTQFDALYATEVALGAGSKELTRVRAAEAQAERNLINQIVSGLSLPLDAAQADVGKFSVAVQALNQGLADGVITSAQWASEMAQISQKAQSDILTMIEGIYTAAGDAKDAEKVKEQLQQINFEIMLAQLQIEAEGLLALGRISTDLYNQVEKIEAYYSDPAHMPNWAAINAGATSASSNVTGAATSINTALQSLITAFHMAKDNIMKVYDALTSGVYGGVAPDKAIAAARAQYDAAMKLADAGDLKGLQDAPAATQAWITALKAFSPALYDIEIPNIESELLRLGHSTTVHDATTGLSYTEQLQQTANSELNNIGSAVSGIVPTLGTGFNALNTSSQVQGALQSQMVAQQTQIVGQLKIISTRLGNSSAVGDLSGKRPVGTVGISGMLRAA